MNNWTAVSFDARANLLLGGQTCRKLKNTDKLHSTLCLLHEVMLYFGLAMHSSPMPASLLKQHVALEQLRVVVEGSMPALWISWVACTQSEKTCAELQMLGA